MGSASPVSMSNVAWLVSPGSFVRTPEYNPSTSLNCDCCSGDKSCSCMLVLAKECVSSSVSVSSTTAVIFFTGTGVCTSFSCCMWTVGMRRCSVCILYDTGLFFLLIVYGPIQLSCSLRSKPGLLIQTLSPTLKLLSTARLSQFSLLLAEVCSKLLHATSRTCSTRS